MKHIQLYHMNETDEDDKIEVDITDTISSKINETIAALALITNQK